MLVEFFPPGHFYSPVVDLDFVKRYESIIWKPQEEHEIVGFDINKEGQRHFLRTNFKKYITDFDYPIEKPKSEIITYYQKNGMFSGLDARALFTFLRTFRPRFVIEIGSGFSSLLTIDTAKRFLGGDTVIIMIEPYPPHFLTSYLNLNSYDKAILYKMPVQDVELELFDQLQENDILFVDSSHVAKVGSDVNHIIFRILPRLHKGVIIHFHDIFLPDEYPKKWVFEENRSWNEQYILRAFLMYNSHFRVLFGSYYASTRLKEDVIYACGDLYGGGSFWLQKIQ